MAADWRHIAQINQRKTSFAIISFLLIYLFLGMMIAVILSPYPNAVQKIPQIISLPQSQQILGIFMLFSMFSVLVAVLFGGRFSLSGTSALKVSAEDHAALNRQLYHVVEEMKIAGGMQHMPSIYIIDAPYMNAFASGWRQKDSIVAITKPLLQALTREELQAVMAHELSHILHQDTKLMTVVSVLSSISIWVIDTIFRSVLYGGGRHGRRGSQRGGPLIVVVFIIRIILPIITAFLVMYVSRSREMMADSGCIKMTRNPGALASALKKIHNAHTSQEMKEAYATTAHNSLRSLAYMYDPNALQTVDVWDINAWFSTHPSLQERLKALGE